jgi:hypothetical protein
MLLTATEFVSRLMGTGDGDGQRFEGLLLDGGGTGEDGEGSIGARAVTMVLRAMVARSASRLWKLWTGRAVGGASRGGFGECLGRASRLGDRTCARGLGGLPIVIVEHGGEAGAEMPLQIVDEHAREDVSAHTALQPIMDRSNVQVNGLQTTRSAFHRSR